MRRFPPATLLAPFIGILLGAAVDDLPPENLPHPKGYVCHRAGEIKVDGRLDEETWAEVPWTDRFVDIEGDRKPLPRFATRVKMAWDDRAFYIAAEMDEPHVWATLTEHDSVIFRDNDFEIFIDPDGDNHEYAEFEVNAKNTGWDLLLPRPYRDGGTADNSFELAGLETAVHVDGSINDPSDLDRGWTVEIAIPWAALAGIAHKSTPPTEGDQWRVNFSRVEWRHMISGKKYEKVPDTKEDNWVWSAQGAVDMHRPERWGYVQFTRAAPGKVSFQPDLTARARDNLMRVYHAQKAYRQRTGGWARSVGELGLDEDRPPPIIIRTTADGYEARAIVALDEHSFRRVTIGPDSRLVVGPIVGP